MKNQSIIPFVFDDVLVRVHLDEEGNPWFVAKDVCKILNIVNYRDAVSRLDDDEKDGVGITDSIGRKQQMVTVSESGLYALIFSSRKPEARRFRKWVTSEVLPALARTGTYTMPGKESLSDAAKRLSPRMRERVLSNAIQTVRLTGSTDAGDVDAYFAKYCEMVAENPKTGNLRMAGMPFSKSMEDENIHRFATVELMPSKGDRINATDMYHAFSVWWRKQFDATLPNMHKFGRVMSEYYPKQKRGGLTYYWNVDFAYTQ